MGCVNEVQSEVEEGETIAIIKSKEQTNITTEKDDNFSKQSSTPDDEKKVLTPDPIDEGRSEAELLLRNKILTKKDALQLPKKFGKWFPKKHAHKKCSKLWKVHKQIGKGVTGVIYSVNYRGHEYALKKIERDNKWGRMLFTTEARVLCKLNHSGIIALIDMFFDEYYYYIIMEKADFDLYYIMTKKGALAERKTKSVVLQLLKAIAYMHSKNMAHRDLKPENIVFLKTDTNHPKLIDFGDAELVKDNRTYTEFVGTPPYMSPERLEEHYGWQLKKSDIWAIGVIAFEMYCGVRCFEGETQKQVFGKILRNDWSWPSDRMPAEKMRDFVEACLQTDAKLRPTAEEACTHEWFGGTMRRESLLLRTRIVDADVLEAYNAENKEEQNNNEKIDQKHDTYTKLFSSLASMIDSNYLQDILIKGYNDRLKPENIELYQIDFDRLDANKDGFISGTDLLTTLTQQGIAAHEASSLASILIEELGCANTGLIDFDTFCASKLKNLVSKGASQTFYDVLSPNDVNIKSDSWISSFVVDKLADKKDNKYQRNFGNTSMRDLIADIPMMDKSKQNNCISIENIQEWAPDMELDADIHDLFHKHGNEDGELTYEQFQDLVQAKSIRSCEIPPDIAALVSEENEETLLINNA